MASGRPSCSNVRNLLGICRSTMPTLPVCLKIATRKRAGRRRRSRSRPRPPPASSCWQRSGVISSSAPTVSSGSSTLVSSLPHVAVQPQHRRLADGDVQVAGALVDDRLQQLVDEDRGHATFPLPERAVGSSGRLRIDDSELAERSAEAEQLPSAIGSYIGAMSATMP